MPAETLADSRPRSTSKPGKAARRTLRFESMQDLLDDVNAMEPGRVSGLGNWTPAQNIEHVRMFIELARKGGDVTIPLPFRLLGRLLRSRLLHSSMKPGLKTLKPFQPPVSLDLGQAITAFREEVALAAKPGAMIQPSPLLGAMTHDDWVRLHCRHAELHFSFIIPAV